MSTLKGATFVLLVTILPPLAIGTTYFLHPFKPTLVLCTLCLPLLYLYYLFVTYTTIPYFTHPLRHLPQPPKNTETFLLAHFPQNYVKPRGEPYRQWIDQIPNDGLIFFRGPFHSFPTVLLTSAEGLEEMLVKKAYEFEKLGTDRWLLERFIGRGLIVVEGGEHKFQRKMVAPAFSGKQISDLVPLFWRKSREFSDVIAKQLDQQENVVEINGWASRVTLDIIGLACVGKDFGSLYNAEDEIATQYERILVTDHGGVVVFALLSIYLPGWLARWQPFNKRVREAEIGRMKLREACRKLVALKKLDMQKEDSSSKHIDILSVLIRSGQFTDDGLVDQLLTFLAAGHETTSGSLAWILYLLATHPHCQKKLCDELTTFFKTHPDGPSSTADLDSLPYLSAIISEQLRLYPNVPMTGRMAVKDTSILGTFIPNGTILLSSPWAINRSHKFWGPDSMSFKPERWLTGKLGTGQGPMSLMTFIHGPRSCIGQAFSRAELKCLVASMVVRFHVEMADPDEVVVPGGLIAMKPKDGLRVRLREL